LHVYEKLRTQLVNRMHQAGMRAEEFIRFEPVCRSNGGTSYGGFVIYSKGRLTGNRPIFNMRIDCAKRDCVIKIWQAVRRDNHFYENGRFFCELLFASANTFRQQLPEITDSSRRAASNPL
jgi:hypothetical protein